MSWWDFATDFASNAWDSLGDYAMPIAGATIGAIANKDNRLAGAALGGLAGYGLSNLNFGTGPSQSSYGTLGTGAPQSQYFSVGNNLGQLSAPTGQPSMGLQAGTFSPQAAGGDSMYSLANITPSTGNSGVTGDNYLRAPGGTPGATESLLGRVESWGAQNPRTSAALGSLVKAGAGLYGASKQTEAMERQNAMQQQAMQSQQQAVTRNNEWADYMNTNSRQAYDEANSLWNPQRVATDQLMQNRKTTDREVNRIAGLQNVGEAERTALQRKARVSGAAGDVTAYTTGFESGQRGQTAARSAAAGLAKPYAGLNPYSPNYDAADMYSQQGKDAGSMLQKNLEFFTGDPSRRVLREREETETRRSV
jgi:hypothetical protein